MNCVIVVMIALLVGLVVGAVGGYLIQRNNRAKVDALENAAKELKK